MYMSITTHNKRIKQTNYVKTIVEMEHTEREEKDITKDLNTKKDFVQTVEKTCYAYKEKLE